jgi:hypothetical protein
VAGAPDHRSVSVGHCTEISHSRQRPSIRCCIQGSCASNGDPGPYHSPWQNGYVERLIGSIRSECTDHLLVFNVEHLRRILSKYASYYNEARMHVSLGKDAPCRRPIEQFGDIVAYPILGGLHHRYARI